MLVHGTKGVVCDVSIQTNKQTKIKSILSVFYPFRIHDSNIKTVKISGYIGGR